ncbi:hypothetical protein MalM25_30460 [Planctomycetes bacterium MalM25]|nr:hypothetical protein MalM25_30460 [Planctomycetes bacterium MalM25]
MDANQLAAELLTDDPSRRREAADRLALIGEEAKPATCALVEACADDDLRDLCVGALEELGPPPATALPRLAELLTSESLDVAYWAATLLGRARANAAPYVADLQRVANDAATPEVVRDRAAWALRKIG